MRVQKVYPNSGYEFALLDDEGLAISVVTDFLGYLRARGCSPNTIVAYAHDLQHLFSFFKRPNIHYLQFTARLTLDFLQYLRAVPSRRKVRKSAPELSGSGPEEPTTQLAPTTVNRILAAVSTFYEYLIVTEAVADSENPLAHALSARDERRIPRVHEAATNDPLREERAQSLSQIHPSLSSLGRVVPGTAF